MYPQRQKKELVASSLYVELDDEYEKLLDEYFSSWNENMAEVSPYFERIQPQIHGHEFKNMHLDDESIDLAINQLVAFYTNEEGLFAGV